jgi:hypothetical protein
VLPKVTGVNFTVLLRQVGRGFTDIREAIGRKDKSRGTHGTHLALNLGDLPSRSGSH